MHVVDSHTGGQPTRVILEGGPDLGNGPLSERKELLAGHFDAFRRKSILEPKAADAMVGALICEPFDPVSTIGVIFFNNEGYLDMCGHGTIGLMATLAYLGEIEMGQHLIETSVGTVKAELLSPNRVSVENVPSYCWRPGVTVDVYGLGLVTGSIAWGGNWFFLADKSPVPICQDNIPALTGMATRVKRALAEQSITGENGAEIDHVEFFQPLDKADVDSRNFVLCPGLVHDRSPCGTGTSAKIACLAADGQLRPGETWVQESVIGSRFSGTYARDKNNQIRPTITGEAFVYADTQLVFQSGDPFINGIGK